MKKFEMSLLPDVLCKFYRYLYSTYYLPTVVLNCVYSKKCDGSIDLDSRVKLSGLINFEFCSFMNCSILHLTNDNWFFIYLGYR